MAEKPAGHILIECPNTIFHLYARDEGELSKIETFLRNIRGIKRLGPDVKYLLHALQKIHIFRHTAQIITGKTALRSHMLQLSVQGSTHVFLWLSVSLFCSYLLLLRPYFFRLCFLFDYFRLYQYRFIACYGLMKSSRKYKILCYPY